MPSTAKPTDVICIASWNADLVSRVPRPIARGETLLASDFDISPGGKGSNAAVACARQGARTAVIARIGRDDFGRMALDLWQREGIATRHVEAASDAIAGCRLVMASCEVPMAATLAAFRIARAACVTTLLNPAPAQRLTAELLALVDVLTPNEHELRTVAGVANDAPLDVAARTLLERGVQAVLVTLGAAGCRLWRRGAAALTVAGWRVEQVVDTIGAGDTFNGALAAGLSRGLAIDQAMRRANAAAALSVGGRGAIGGMPTAAQVDALLARG